MRPRARSARRPAGAARTRRTENARGRRTRVGHRRPAKCARSSVRGKSRAEGMGVQSVRDSCVPEEKICPSPAGSRINAEEARRTAAGRRRCGTTPPCSPRGCALRGVLPGRGRADPQAPKRTGRPRSRRGLRHRSAHKTRLRNAGHPGVGRSARGPGPFPTRTGQRGRRRCCRGLRFALVGTASSGTAATARVDRGR